MTATERDDRLAALIAGLADQLRAGRAPDVEAAARGNPDLAAELRELWAVAQFAQLARAVPLASTVAPAAAPGPDTTPGPADPDDGGGPLPREFGDFVLLEELGRGGMGVVYKARQTSLNRVVALKMVREAHLAGPADRARFRAEAEAAARLHHPNIVTVHEVGSLPGPAGGQAYFCMEYVPGRTLARRVAADGPLPPREAARLVAVLARAVQHAHDHGVLHRDLKPSNILLTEVGPRPPGAADPTPRPGPPIPWEPKVADFGLAKQVGRAEPLTRSGAVVGTPSYMAPEQATGRKDVTPAADVYALGAILYECLTGRPPFRAATAVDTVMQVLSEDPVPPRALNPGVPRDLELVCLKCLQKPADLRYPSAAALAADLDAYLAGDPMAVETHTLGSWVARNLRETHHAAVLENWGLLWMWHSLMILLLCLLTQVMGRAGVGSHAAYLALWGAGLFTWAAIFWQLRRRGGPVLFVERQIAHAWAGGVVASIGLFGIEVVQGLPPLTLSPVLAVIAGVVFLVKAGTLAGHFYLSAGAYFLTAVAMAAFPGYGHLVFGLVSAATFFVPGLKYYRQRKRAQVAGAG